MTCKISLLFTILFAVFFSSGTQDILIDNGKNSQFNLQIKIDSLSRSVTPLSIKDLSIFVNDTVNGAKLKDISWVPGGTNTAIGLNIEYNKKYTVSVIHNEGDTNNAVTSSVDVTLSPGMGALVKVIPGDTKSLSVTYFSVQDAPAGFTLVWQEDFNTLNTSIWNIETGSGVNGWGNWELQCYTDRPDNVYIENGNLVIKAIREDFVDQKGETKSFTSARLNTLGKVSFKYGKIRARIKVPYGKGIWPAFWMLGDSFPDIGWAYCGEIDIMEVKAGDPGDIKNNIVYGTAHWHNGIKNVEYGLPYTHSSPFYEDYYIFEAEWDGTYIHTRVAATEEELNTKAPFWSILIIDELQAFKDKYFHLLLNVAVGGLFTGITHESGITTHMPQKMLVDWIKVYQRPNIGSDIKTSINTTVSIDNIKNNGTLNSGAIIGKAFSAGTIQQIEVKVDNEEFAVAEGTDNWKFKLPVSANRWKTRSTHTISVRAKDVNGLYTDVVTVTIKKGVNKDINGDGYSDLVVAGGKVYIFNGRATGIPSGHSSTADSIITGSSKANVIGDINGDGYADLMVSSLDESLYVFHGKSSGLSSGDISSADKVITGVNANSLIISDINNDGYSDLIAGSSSSQKVYILYGGLSGISVNSGDSSDAVLDGETGFGLSIAAGDINGDGYIDIVVSQEGFTIGLNNTHGIIHCFLGSSSGISSKNASQADSKITKISSLLRGRFGDTLSIGDINGDGYGDLIISGYTGVTATPSGSTISTVYIYNGSTTGISTRDAGAYSATLHGCEVGPIVGDINNDGYSDVLVIQLTKSGSLVDSGRLGFFYGNENGFPQYSIPDKSFSDSDGIKPSRKYLLRDLNGDGYQDIVSFSTMKSTFTSSDYVYLFTFNSGYTEIVSKAVLNGFSLFVPINK
ncbi:MAG: FG-GAP repeat protein [Spirochaetes bacterium]|nr:FG-GAP repeat protein [Spirochaetota bacterium]